MHGDIYGHNILWRSSDGQSLLGDFGAATPTNGLDVADKEGLQRLEVSAFQGLCVGGHGIDARFRGMVTLPTRVSCNGPY